NGRARDHNSLALNSSIRYCDAGGLTCSLTIRHFRYSVPFCTTDLLSARQRRCAVGTADLSAFRTWLADQVMRVGSTRRLSEAAGLAEDTVYRLLTEPALAPDAETCEKLAITCGVAPALLLEWVGYDRSRGGAASWAPAFGWVGRVPERRALLGRPPHPCLHPCSIPGQPGSVTVPGYVNDTLWPAAGPHRLRG